MSAIVKSAIGAELAKLTRGLDLPKGAFGYGSDLSCATDLTESMEEVDPFSRRALAEAIVRRLGTPQGALPDDPNYGMDLRAEVNRGTTDALPESLAGRIRLELENDDRIESIAVIVTPSPKDVSLNVELQVLPVDPRVGTFTLTLSVSPLEVLLEALGIGAALFPAAPRLPVRSSLSKLPWPAGMAALFFPDDRSTTLVSSGALVTIYDRIGRRVLRQGTPSARPAWHDADAFFGGRASVGFDVGKSLASSGPIPAGWSEFTIIACVRHRNASGGGVIFNAELGTDDSFAIYFDTNIDPCRYAADIRTLPSGWTYERGLYTDTAAARRCITTVDRTVVGAGSIAHYVDGVLDFNFAGPVSAEAGVLADRIWSMGFGPYDLGLLAIWPRILNATEIAQADAKMEELFHQSLASLGKILWFLDFNRADLATFVSGKLAQIQSAAGDGYVFAADAGHELTYNASSFTFGGRRTVTTTGAEILTSLSSIEPPSSGILTLVFVAKFSTATTHILIQTSPDVSAYDESAYLAISGFVPQVLYNHGGAHTAKNATTATGTSSVRRYIATIDARHINSGIEHYLNGVNDGGAYVDASAPDGGWGAYPWSIFAAPGPAVGAACECSMVLAFDGIPSIAALDDFLRRSNGL